ncbi:MAG: 50S ribosomal protein L19 [bacterium]|nr:50S ribosomal protein L19 [bacterium]
MRPGMIVRVHERIVDVNNKGEEKSRIQIFEGMIIGIKSPGISRTMTVRKNSNGFMVEKIYPLASPNVTKVEIVKQHKVRRAKLGFLRGTFKRKMKEKK